MSSSVKRWPGRGLVENVEGRAADGLGRQRPQQRLIVHDARAGDVEEIGGRLHLGEFLFTEELLGLLRKPEMYGYEIGLREQLFQGDGFIPECTPSKAT